MRHVAALAALVALAFLLRRLAVHPDGAAFDLDWLAEYDPARHVRWPYGGTVS